MTKEPILQSILNSLKAKTYLEIGVSKGYSFESIRAREKIGVDPRFRIKPAGIRAKIKRLVHCEKVRLFEMTSDDFFSREGKNFRKKIDVTFVDGLHTFEQSLRDILNSLECLAPRGVIAV